MAEFEKNPVYDPEKAEKQRQKDLETLRNSYDMYELSRAEAIERRKNKVDKDGNRIYTDESLEETLELINTMQEDIISKYVQLGGTVEELKARKPKKRSRKKIEEMSASYNEKDALREYSRQILEDAKKREKNKYVSEEEEKKPERKERTKVHSFENIPEPKVEYVPEQPLRTEYTQTVKTNQGFDEVSLPSKGECYRTKADRLRVSHLTAYDENLILSPGLYKNGTFLDHILKNKILDSVNPDDLIQGDRDAIIIWLRAGGYGPMYPIRVTDDKTGQEFETTVDLSKLNFRKFTLKGDENGYFDFKMPNSGDMVKFKFLTAGDAKKLNKMRDTEKEASMSGEVRDKIRDLKEFFELSEKFSSNEKDKIFEDLDDLDEAIYERYKDVEDPEFTRDMTNRMIMSTISVNGITDRKYVSDYILNLNLKDAAEYRKYIVDNEPGIDYNIKVKRPDSLGGGYIETFLQLDQFIFVY